MALKKIYSIKCKKSIFNQIKKLKIKNSHKIKIESNIL